jgi:hypothetical protein
MTNTNDSHSTSHIEKGKQFVHQMDANTSYPARTI